MRAVLVVNPKATATTAAGRDVLAHALASEVKLEILETDYRGHAMAAAAQAAVDGADLVVAHGGDGTVNEVVNGLLATGPRNTLPMLGIVPGGSANVFARSLGLPRDPVDATHQLLHALQDGRSAGSTSAASNPTAPSPRGGSRSAPASAGTPTWSRRSTASGARRRAPRCTPGSRRRST